MVAFDHQRASRSSRAAVSPLQLHRRAASLMAQRAPTCACGGGCPRCQHRLPIQPKLAVSQPGDPYEQEADRVAEQVMEMPESKVQRQCAACATGGLLCTACEEEDLVAVSRKEDGPAVGEGPAQVHSVLRSAGEPLADATRGFFEPRFGQDLGHVRVHTDRAAQQSARDINALAYTVGSHVVFAPGYYNPGSSEGRLLLAHELAHVAQQTEGLSPRVQRVCGSVAIGTPGGCVLAPSMFSGGSVFRFNVGCDDYSSGQEAGLLAFVRAQPASAAFKIHGYASIDGLAAFNQNLACARALKAQTSMISAGIAASRITDILNHGPTPGPANERRGVVIEAITSGPPAPRTGAITSQTVATSPGGRARTTIGVGEEVDLTFSLGSTTWSTTAGTLNFVSGNPGPTVRFTAPDTSQFVAVTAGTAPTASIILFAVLAPTSVAMDRQPGTGVKHTVSQPDSGIQTRVFIGPDSVNFNKVRYREIDVNPTVTGTYSCHVHANHCGAGAGSACPDKALTDRVVAGMGTQSVLGDCAYSGHCGVAPPFVPGSLAFAIPYEYRVGAGPFRRFVNVAQVHTLAPDASTLTTRKAGANGTTTVASPTVTIPQCP